VTRQLRFIVKDAGEGWLCATSPDIPGAVTQGKTLDELAIMARDCAASMLDAEPWEVDIDLVIPSGLAIKGPGEAA
jgi:predicted RNase H-like HicB family nuclease